MKPNKPTSKNLQSLSREYLDIAEKVRTGEYFREARNAYDNSVNDPMSERYLYLFIMALTLTSLVIAFGASESLYPLNRPVAYIFNVKDPTDDVPHMKSLLINKEDNANEAVLRYLAQNYVLLRERYDINEMEHDSGGIKSQSSNSVYKEYERVTDPHNPDSPVALYQRYSRRKIQILSCRRLHDEKFGMEVAFEASVETKGDVKKTHWLANLAFKYSGIEVDSDTGKPKPFEFIVTDYRTKRLQDLNPEVKQDTQ